MNLELNQDNNIKEIIDLIRNSTDDDALRLALEDYHDKDLAEALEELSAEERKKLYRIIGPERTGEVFSFLREDVDTYLSEVGLDAAAKIVEEMDTDDAVDLLDQIDDTIEQKILAKMDDKVEEEIRLIQTIGDLFMVVQNRERSDDQFRELIGLSGLDQISQIDDAAEEAIVVDNI